ncbi:hypothetical protein ACFLY6_01965 [Candidatus Dependentiae bacterium]
MKMRFIKIAFIISTITFSALKSSEVFDDHMNTVLNAVVDEIVANSNETDNQEIIEKTTNEIVKSNIIWLEELRRGNTSLVCQKVLNMHIILLCKRTGLKTSIGDLATQKIPYIFSKIMQTLKFNNPNLKQKIKTWCEFMQHGLIQGHFVSHAIKKIRRQNET